MTAKNQHLAGSELVTLGSVVNRSITTEASEGECNKVPSDVNKPLNDSSFPRHEIGCFGSGKKKLLPIRNATHIFPATANKLKEPN